MAQCPLDVRTSRTRNVLPLFRSTGKLSATELDITEVEDATALLSYIHRGRWTAEQVTTAFCKRAALAHQLINCLMDADFDAAIQRARELDAYFARTGSIVGPLHGLPINIKDLTEVKGLHYTMGYVSWADCVSTEDAVVVASLRKAGAVIYVKTTMPQSGMCLETVSNLFGRTLSPFNTSLAAGGSSGGAGALTACRGSLVGIGTDSGGSIRVPAAFNGLYSLKPTKARLSYKGNANNSPGLGSGSAIGPMAHSVRDLTLITKVLLDDQPWDSDAAVVYKPWSDDQLLHSNITIGLIEWDGVVMPHPPIRRAIKIARARLEAAGHKIVMLEPFQFATAYEISSRMFYTVGTGFIKDALSQSGEPPIPSIKHKVDVPSGTVEQLAEAHKNWNAYKDAHLQWWMQTARQTSTGRPVDALLLPVCASVSFPHDYVQLWGYNSIYNMLDHPCVTLPVTEVDKTIDHTDLTYEAVSDKDRSNHHMYDPELFDGMPVGLQLVGRPYTEEKVLHIAGLVDEAIHFGKEAGH
ncbi:general amidase [Thozetella sp. PMI_491]|nr:general amidase [Thozetella sp. PMI_491]